MGIGSWYKYTPGGFAADKLGISDAVEDSFNAKQAYNTDPENAKLQNRDFLDKRIKDSLNAIRSRRAPQAGYTQIGQVQQMGVGNQFRTGQMNLANRLEGIASGQQQGAGELAARRAANAAIAQQQAMARMQRGSGAAMGAREAARNSANIGLAGAGQAQQAALQDQQAANAQLAGVLGQGRQGDMQIGLANMDAQNQRIFQQAGLNQATSLANMQARLQSMGMNDQATLAYLAQLYGMDAAEMQARIQQEGIEAGSIQPAMGPAIMGQAGQLATAGAIFSDRELKKDIRKTSRSIDDLLDKLEPQAYRYKDKKFGEGRYHGIMAQDLEKSEAGKRLVMDTPEGKMVDTVKGFGTAMAAMARLNERIRHLEKGR